VEVRDTPIYFDGIGTVQAYNSVTIHTQVDGVLQKVAFKEGQDVKAGDLLAMIDPRSFQAQLDQAKAKMAADEAQLSSAKMTYDRNSSLLSKGLIDQQTVDTEKATVDQLTASVQADAAAVEQQAVQLGYTQIRAPFPGRTGVRLVDQGNVVHSTDATGLVVITQLQPISVVFTLPQQDWPQLQSRLAGGTKLKAIAMGASPAGPLDEGELSVVDNQIDTTTGTIKLKAVFPNEKMVLWPGQFVNIRLLVQTRAKGVVVPASVIQRGPDGAFAFVIKSDSTVEARPVQVSQIDDGVALIDGGLKPGEDVVVDGQYKLQVGSKVTTASPGGASTGGGKAARQKSS
jgi:multidrug efflux system membrane fusion protein